MFNLLKNWQTVLTVSGIAAFLAVCVVYLLRKMFEAKIKIHFEREIEKFRVEIDYIKENIRMQREHLPELSKAIYKARNIARDMHKSIPGLNAGLRSSLGDIAFFITENLYGTRIFLSRELFEKIHSYKKHLQNFIFEYDAITEKKNSKSRSSLQTSIKRTYEKIDELHTIIIDDIQKVLNIDKT
jgi:hypothetical protein